MLTGPNHKKVTNPLVVCLNLTGCDTEETGQARVRFQFGIWDANIRHWECCPISSVIVNLDNTSDLISVGYKSLNIFDRHLDSGKQFFTYIFRHLFKRKLIFCYTYNF